MFIAKKLGYDNIVKRLILAGASNTNNATELSATTNITPDGSVTEGMNMENKDIALSVPPSTVSKFQDLYPLQVVSAEPVSASASPNAPISVSTDSGEERISKLSGDRFHDLHAPPAQLTELTGQNTIHTENILQEQSEETLTSSSIDRFADLHPPTETSSLREDFSMQNNLTGDSAVSACSSTILSVSTGKASDIQSDGEEDWFVVPFDASEYPTQESVLPTGSVDESPNNIHPTTVDAPSHEARTEVTTLDDSNPQGIAVAPLLVKQQRPNRQNICIRKIAARQRRRREMRNMRRAARDMNNVKKAGARSQNIGENSMNKRSAKKRTGQCNGSPEIRKHRAERNKSPFLGSFTRGPDCIVATKENVAEEQQSSFVPLSEVTALKEELTQQVEHSATLSARLDKLTAQLQNLQNILKVHYKDEHEHIEWDQEIVFVRRHVRYHLFACMISYLAQSSLLSYINHI